MNGIPKIEVITWPIIDPDTALLYMVTIIDPPKIFPNNRKESDMMVASSPIIFKNTIGANGEK